MKGQYNSCPILTPPKNFGLRKCDEMKEEVQISYYDDDIHGLTPDYGNRQLGHLAKHFEIVGGDKDVIMASNELSEALSSLVKSAKKVLDSKAGEGIFSASIHPSRPRH